MHVGFDYSSSAAYFGIVSDNKVLAYGKIAVKDYHDTVECYNLFLMLKDLFRGMINMHQIDPDVFIEQPWINGKVFPRSAVLLTRMATYIEIAALSVGLHPIFVHPLTWRKKIYGNGRPKGDVKKLALATVDKEFNFIPKDHNYAEAILISQYGNILEEPEE